MDNSSSSTNTVLIVIVLLLIVGFGVWWFARTPAPKQMTDENTADIQIDLGGDSMDGTPANPEPVTNY